MVQDLGATTSSDLIKGENRSNNVQTTRVPRLSSVAGKEFHQLVWVTVGKTDHPAWLLGESDGSQQKVLVQWESTRGIEEVPITSIHFNFPSQRKRHTRTEINVSSFGTGRIPKVGDPPKSNTKQTKRKRSTSAHGDQEETEHSSNTSSRKKHRVKVGAAASKATKHSSVSKASVPDGTSGVKEVGRSKKASKEESLLTSTGHPYNSLQSESRKADSSKSRAPAPPKTVKRISHKSLLVNKNGINTADARDSLSKAGGRKSLSVTIKDLVVSTVSSETSVDNSRDSDDFEIEQSNGRSMLALSMSLLPRDENKAKLKRETSKSVEGEEEVTYDSSDDDAEKVRTQRKLLVVEPPVKADRAVPSKSVEKAFLRPLFVALLARAPGKYKVCFSLDGVNKLRKEIEEDVGLLLEEQCLS
jgi:hypothetical protein